MSISDAGSAVARGHELQVMIDTVYEKYLPHTTGEVATYIPELGKADPDAFGICLVTADGRTFEAGDCDRPFTIQSISKPFTFGMALEEFGATKVLRARRRGAERRCLQLQSSCRTARNRPYNPMINSGAITVTALLHERYGDRTFDYLLDRFSAIAGRQLVDRLGGLRVRAAHWPSQPRDRPPAAELRPGARRGRSRARHLLQAVRDPW